MNIFSQTDTLHDVYTTLDREETVAMLKLKDGLDRLHQSKMIHKVVKGHFFSFILWYLILDNSEYELPVCPSNTFLNFSCSKGCVDFGMLLKIGGSVVCSPGRTKLDRERTSQCLAEIVKLYKWLQFNANFYFFRKTSGIQRGFGGLRSPQGISGKNTEV